MTEMQMSETALSRGAMENRNESEKLFEQYLNLNGFSGKWIYEPAIQGKNTRPDYLLNHNGRDCFFEVKELRKKPNEPTERAAHINPYSSLRKEIHEVRKQFREYKDYSCSLVVFNVGDNTFCYEPLFIFGAMLGNLGLRADYNPEKMGLSGQSPRTIFLGGGKMINYRKKKPQNTTISAVIILEEFLDNIEIEKAMIEKAKKHGKKFTGPEYIIVRMELQKKYSVYSVPRVLIVENPFARIAFPECLFVGPFDERWRWTEKNGKVERVFVGRKLKELEELKGKS